MARRRKLLTQTQTVRLISADRSRVNAIVPVTKGNRILYKYRCFHCAGIKNGIPAQSRYAAKFTL